MTKHEAEMLIAALKFRNADDIEVYHTGTMYLFEIQPSYHSPMPLIGADVLYFIYLYSASRRMKYSFCIIPELLDAEKLLDMTIRALGRFKSIIESITGKPL